MSMNMINDSFQIGFDYVGISTPFYCIDEKGRLLLHKRTQNCRDEHDRWDTGSGKLEFGSTLEENVLREVVEEYGCHGDIICTLPAHSILRSWENRPTHWLAVPFFVRVNQLEVKNNEPEKISDMGWFTLNTLPSPLHSGFAYTLSKFRVEFEKLILK